ncbi:MAG: ammonium transporter [Maritimibacter sp.]|jgi:ammonium transporter, Amt family
MKRNTFLSVAALAAGAVPMAAQAQEAAEVVNKGDVAWMMTASLLVMFMIVPGLALFYGGLVRTKNMLSVLMQTTLVAAMAMVAWVLYGYSFAFGGAGTFWGGLDKLFLSGVTLDSTAATFTDGVVLPEYVFIAFQMTFAAITPALIIGAFAERIKFSATLLFSLLWITFIYFPIAHMVWGEGGLVLDWGAIDFAGGTVVHINAGIAALVAALVIGPRVGFGKDNMAPHSMTLTMVGAGMLWVGWFGFNAGSNLEATSGATLAMLNTFIATAAAALSWSLVEAIFHGRPSGLGAASGVVAGLVAVTPACGTSGPVGALILGLVVSPVSYFFVAKVKNKFGYDDSLDVFGVHGIGGIVGAIGTGILASTSLGGTGFVVEGGMALQVWVQIKAVLVTLVWSGVGSLILLYVVKAITGLRVSEEEERIGLDTSSHGESAYNM